MSQKKISLACEICRTKNYQKNKSNTARLIISKYCKKCKINQIHKEEK
ncbi:50S ribosomal protein L33 [Mycoplasma iguanae]|uniref:Large ribosomal subunit protein bL33 n=1 Tax=Mycoplasma iguanae TaxID=292461 RepID=A0ABY5R9U9_9MOLU|nr:50S ribosomal protein L33 [Mycoplasma iguanae]UVD81962.1 50S ribosomal protein L33 [Mycoplasma iguanae]